jgi:hypothetical protein
VVFNDGESMAYDGGRTNGRRIARVWQCPFQAGAWADHPQVSDYLKKAATITHSGSVHAGRPNYHEDGHRPLKRDLWASVSCLRPGLIRRHTVRSRYRVADVTVG